MCDKNTKRFGTANEYDFVITFLRYTRALLSAYN